MDVASNDSQLITFNSVRNSACITIVIPRDDVVENEEFFGLMLWSSDNYVTFKNPIHLVQIIDCNSKIIHNVNWKKIAWFDIMILICIAYNISLSQPMYVVMESDMKLNVCVDVMGNIQRPIYAFIEILPMRAEGTCLLVVVFFCLFV